MELDGLALDQDGLESLDTQSVQGRRAVEHDRMLFDDILEDVPDLAVNLFDQLLGVLDILGNLSALQFLHDKGLEQFQRHLLGDTALVDLQLGTDDDNASSRVVDTLAQKVLAETSGFTLQHIGEGLEGTVAGTCDRAASAAVVNQGIDGFLKHALLVADDDIGRAELQKSLQTIVSVDDPAVQVVEVGSREAAAVQLYHGTDIGGNDGDAVQNHPGGRIAGLAESLDHLDALDDAGPLLACRLIHLGGQLLIFFFHVDLAQQILDGLGTHTGAEAASPFIPGFLIFLLGQNLFVLQICGSLVQDNIGSEVKDLLQHLRGNVEDQTHTAGYALEIPDVGDRSRQLDVAHALTAHTGLGDLNTAVGADFTLVSDLLQLTAMAFPVFGRPENPFAEKAVALRLESSVIDGLGLGHFALGPLADLLR